MRNFTAILFFITCFLIFTSLLVSQQLTKFEKWQQPSFFRGFCISDWNNLTDTYVSQAEFNQLKATGANLVIIQTGGFKAVNSPYGPSIWYSEPGYIIYWQDVLDDMVSFARNAKIQYVIAVRSGPGRVDVAEDEGGSTIWTNENEQQLYGEMLKEMANRYLPDTLFVGFDLTVEPNPHGELAGEPVEVLAQALASDGIDVNAIYSNWINAVRTVAPDLPLMVQGVHWSNPAYFSLVKKQPDNKIVYKTHCYNPFDFSHAEDPLSETYPGIFWSDALQDMAYFDKSFFMQTVFGVVKDFQQNHNVPVLIGEFGLNYPQNGGEKYLSDIMSIAENFGWHFSLWNWNNTESFNYPYFDQIYNTHYMDMISKYLNRSTTGVNSLKNSNTTVKEFRLQQNYPNPFNPETRIEYSLPGPAQVKITVYDVNGHLVRNLVSGQQTAGIHSVKWDGRDNNGNKVVSGIYFYHFKARGRRQGFSQTNKMILMK
ncbi:MAG: cellulase family glycosylhydrolase [Calditrichaeota bacterium]|nr:cellulase family glycosylhydrolase [Calditrichota bacterium]